MKRVFVLAALLLLSSASLFAKLTSLNDYSNGNYRLFFEDGVQIAKWQYDKNGSPTIKEGKILNGAAADKIIDKDNIIYFSTRKYKNNKIVDGIYKVYYEGNKLYRVFEYKNEKLEGVDKTFYKNGQTQYIINWSNGKRNGEFKEFYEHGSVAITGNFKDDTGTLKFYDTEGNLGRKCDYVDNLNTNTENYYISGQLEDKSSFINEKPEGIYVSYYESGAKQIEANYANGQLNGPYKVYNENGTVRKQGNYKNGVMEKGIFDWLPEINHGKGITLLTALAAVIGVIIVFVVLALVRKNSPDSGNVENSLQSAPAAVKTDAAPANPAALPRVPTYRVWAIIAALLFLPTGLVALFYSRKIDEFLKAGDTAGAERASKTTRIWCWIGMIVGVLFTALYILGKLSHGR